MAGLLDIIDDPQQMGLLSLGLRLMQAPGKFGAALGSAGMGALGDVQAVRAAAEQKKQRDLQAQAQAQQIAMQKVQLDQILTAQARQKAVEEAYRGAIRAPEQVAMAQYGGPTKAAAANAGSAQPAIDQAALLRGLAQADPKTAFEMMQPKPDELMAVAPGSAVINKRDPSKPVYTAPKEQTLPQDWQLYQLSGAAARGVPFDEWNRANKRSGASSVSVNTGDRIPVPLVKAQDELIDKMSVARSTDADLGAISKQIATGKLKFGPVRNLVNTGKNIAGVSDEESRAFGTFKSTLEKLRNDSLRLNAGVQTEGDAQRAWNELFQNINDTDFVQKRLGEIRNINKRAADLHGYRLNILRANSGAGPLQPAQIAPAIQSQDDRVVDFGSLK